MPNLEALLISKDNALLKIMTRVLVEAAFETTICTDSDRLAEIAVEANLAVLVFDCPEVDFALGLIRQAHTNTSHRPRVIVVRNRLDRPDRALAALSDVLITKPVTTSKARQALRQVTRVEPHHEPCNARETRIANAYLPGV